MAGLVKGKIRRRNDNPEVSGPRDKVADHICRNRDSGRACVHLMPKFGLTREHDLGNAILRRACLPAGDHSLHVGKKTVQRAQAGDVDGHQEMTGAASPVGDIGAGDTAAIFAPRQQT